MTTPLDPCPGQQRRQRHAVDTRSRQAALVQVHERAEKIEREDAPLTGLNRSIHDDEVAAQGACSQRQHSSRPARARSSALRLVRPRHLIDSHGAGARIDPGDDTADPRRIGEP